MGSNAHIHFDDNLMQCPEEHRLNALLAELLGWTNMSTTPVKGCTDIDWGTELQGYSPEAEGYIEQVPNWSTDFEAAAALMARYNVSLDLCNPHYVTAYMGAWPHADSYIWHTMARDGNKTVFELAALTVTTTLAAYLQKRNSQRRSNTPWPWPTTESVNSLKSVLEGA